MPRLLILVLTALPLLACPKRVEPKVSGSADAQMERHAAELEELRSRALAEEDSREATCAPSGRVCALSRAMCELSAAEPEREDFQRQCLQGQEGCALFRDSCARP